MTNLIKCFFQRRKSILKKTKEKKNVSELDAPTLIDTFGFNSTELNLAGAQITQGVSKMNHSNS